jgi:hypothetical protein
VPAPADDDVVVHRDAIPSSTSRALFAAQPPRPKRGVSAVARLIEERQDSR